MGTPAEPRIIRPYRRPLFRSRAIRQAVEVVATIGLALLLSYLILRIHW